MSRVDEALAEARHEAAAGRKSSALALFAILELLAERLPVPDAQVSAEQRRKVEAAVRRLRAGDLCRVVFRGIADGDDQYATTEPMARVDAHALVRSIEQGEERIEVVSEADWQHRIGGGA